MVRSRLQYSIRGVSHPADFIRAAVFKKELELSPCRYLWLPDVFGYSWALPQILKKSGIDTFITTKISWNQYNRMPHDTFVWKGIDGSEVLAHFITTPDGSEKYTYNGEIEARSIQGIWDQYRDRAFNDELLLSYGYGDGGGGVNRDMLENIRRLDAMPGIPNVKTGRVDDFLEGLHQRVTETDQYVHKWDGELYLEYHRGTYTSQAYNKKMNRTAELQYRRAEWLDTLAFLRTEEWSETRFQRFHEGWKIILRNQFHDIIPGSSIKEVYEDSTREYAEALELATTNEREVLDELLQDNENTWTVFNPASHQRSVLVEIPAAEGSWKDSDGEELIVQKETGGEKDLLLVPAVPALGYKTIGLHLTKTYPERSPFNYSSGRLSSPFYDIEWNEQGQLCSIYDKDHAKEVLSAPGNVLEVFEDKPMAYDAWDIDIFYKEKCYPVTELEKMELVEAGRLRAVIEMRWRYQSSIIRQRFIVYSHSRRLDFETVLDWHEQQQLLKAAFPVNIRSNEATYDIQYGNVKRPTHWNTSWDMARFETVGHQWADISERAYGVSLLNNCKYGYDIKDNIMKLTLLKSAIQPDPTQDQGEHLFTYSLYPHKGDWFEGNTVQEGMDLNIPPIIAKGSTEKRKYCFLQPKASNITVDAVKQSEEGNAVIVRCHEHGGIRGPITFKSDHPLEGIIECNLLEQELEEEKHVDGQLVLEFHPYEIKTIKLK